MTPYPWPKLLRRKRKSVYVPLHQRQWHPLFYRAVAIHLMTVNGRRLG